MDTLWYALAQSLAPDYLWPVLLLVAILAIMGGLGVLGVRIDSWRRVRHYRRGSDGEKRDSNLHGDR